jgi:hypothetical protein
MLHLKLMCMESRGKPQTEAFEKRRYAEKSRHGANAHVTLAALNAAIDRRRPPPGCVHHSDSQRINASFRAAWLS